MRKIVILFFLVCVYYLTSANDNVEMFVPNSLTESESFFDNVNPQRKKYDVKVEPDGFKWVPFEED